MDFVVNHLDKYGYVSQEQLDLVLKNFEIFKEELERVFYDITEQNYNDQVKKEISSSDQKVQYLNNNFKFMSAKVREMEKISTNIREIL